MIWLRLHTKTRHDRQLQQMPAELFRHLVNIWTLAKDFDEGGELPCLADTAFELRLQEDEAASVLVKLAGMGLLVKNKGSYSVKNWDFWQYRDDSKNRMRELRRRKRDVLSDGMCDGSSDAECDGKSDGSCDEISDTSDAHRAEQSRAEQIIAPAKPARTTKPFAKPTPAEVEEYARSIGFHEIDGEYFCSYYESRGWKPNGSRTVMTDWKATVVTWKKNAASRGNGKATSADEPTIRFVPKKRPVEDPDDDFDPMSLFGEVRQ